MIDAPWEASFDRAHAALERRGPDESGVWRQPDVCLGHRRLSVIDLHTGQQPMQSDDGRYVLVYNGEIYNFRSLQNELESRGIQFKTRSDTEVLLQGYVTWGEDVLQKLDGMFAFAIWDNREQVLFAARDRFGIKPFYYADSDGLTFASTIGAFTAIDSFPRRLNYAGLREYLATGVVHAPYTIFRDVHVLEPGCLLTWRRGAGGASPKRWWDIPAPVDQPMSFDALAESTDAALTESVGRQTVADVPVGTFLSGGIDSSLIVHYLAKANTRPLRTFSVRFHSGDRYDESAFARMIAQQYETQHTEFDAAELDGAALAAAIDAMDQPFGDSAFVPTLELSRLTRQHVTVAMSGDGGDEMFGGYPRYLGAADRYPRRCRHGALAWAIERGLLPASLMRHSLYGNRRVLWDRVRLGPFDPSRKSMAAMLSPDIVAAFDVDQTMANWRGLLQRFGPRIDSDALMRADLWTYLADDCLVKTDRASMHHSLEVRVPMLGNPVADLVLAQPASIKLQGGIKAVLKELARRHTPRPVWDRRKHGFTTPLPQYFAGVWREQCEAWLEAQPQVAPFLNSHQLQRRWRRILEGHGDTRLMYALLVLVGWLEKNRVEV